MYNWCKENPDAEPVSLPYLVAIAHNSGRSGRKDSASDRTSMAPSAENEETHPLSENMPAVWCKYLDERRHT